MYFDTHTHLDDDKFNEDREAVIAKVRESGVELAVNVGSGIKESESCIALAEKYDFIYAAVGVHPGNTGNMTDADLELVKQMASHEKVVAIGEIGLDYYYDEPERDVQKYWFRKQLELAKELQMPYIIHDRDAHADTLDIIREVGYTKGVMHCYSGSVEMAKVLIKMGFYISIAGQVTFKNAPKLQEVAKFVPVEHLLIETDSPYLTPVPFRGKRNDSSNVAYTCAKIAELKGMDEKELANITLINGKKFYGLE
ncbi:MAG: TatD family hydrolase [Clostridia bacterium]|nr:TatD family hydrolase [Clostridia bacterium]